MIDIRNRYTGELILRVEGSLREANLRGADLIWANLFEANLRGADLIWANLFEANLRGACLRGANLFEANLRGADLFEADLRGARLRGANLFWANLSEADLSEADLREANLIWANLFEANLRGADLFEADLRGADPFEADLRGIRDDIESILALAPAEVPGLRAALAEGRVDGSTYDGECACLVGTIAHVRGVEYRQLGDLRPDPSRPAERWFLGIARGDTPETNPVSKITLGWVDEWLDANGGAS